MKRVLVAATLLAACVWIWPETRDDGNPTIHVPPAPVAAVQDPEPIAPIVVTMVARPRCAALVRLDGEVTDYEGEPLRGVRVLDGAQLAATTGADGRFAADGPFPSGVLTLRAEGYAPWSERLPACRAVWHVDAALAASSSVRGVVLLDGMPLAEVSVDVVDPEVAYLMPPTGAAGRFHLDAPAFPITLRAVHRRYGSTELVVDKPGEVTIELDGNQALFGQVLTPDSTPVTAFTVEVKTQHAEPLLSAVFTGAGDGRFGVGPVGNEPLMVIVTTDTGQSATLVFSALDGERVMVVEDSLLVHGRVWAPDGSPLADGRVMIRSATTETDVLTQPDGTFAVRTTTPLDELAVCVAAAGEPGSCTCQAPAGRSSVEVDVRMVPSGEEFPHTVCGELDVRWDGLSWRAVPRMWVKKIIRLDDILID